MSNVPAHIYTFGTQIVFSSCSMLAHHYVQLFKAPINSCRMLHLEILLLLLHMATPTHTAKGCVSSQFSSSLFSVSSADAHLLRVVLKLNIFALQVYLFYADTSCS